MRGRREEEETRCRKQGRRRGFHNPSTLWAWFIIASQGEGWMDGRTGVYRKDEKRRAEKIERMQEYGECISETIRLCPPALLLFRLTSQLCNWDSPYLLWIVHPNLTRANNCKQQIPKFFLSVNLLSFVYCGHFSLKPKDVCREEGRAHRRPRLHVLSKTIRRRQAQI